MPSWLKELTTRSETEKKEKELAESKARAVEATAAADRLRAQRTAYIGGALKRAAPRALYFALPHEAQRPLKSPARECGGAAAEVECVEESERAKDRFLANVS
ncbi:MAG: hypothetical protein IPJ85_16285 [Flavobacteriales bacterium]|nr:hypothetical protein [Flavobacteriales bacterium]